MPLDRWYTAKMRVDVFLGDDMSGKLLGEADVDMSRNGRQLTVYEPSCMALWDMIGRVQPNGVSSVTFALLTDEHEFQQCRIVGMGGAMRISFLRERKL